MAMLPLVFEVGLLKGSRVAGQVRTVPVVLSVHALAVGPTDISWSDPPRDDVMLGVDAAEHVHAGRGLAVCQISGTFGYAPRGLGLVFGTGEERQRRFENEIIALSSCVTKTQKDECVRKAALLGFENATVGIGSVLRKKLANYDPATDAFYANIYDFNAGRRYKIAKLDYRNAVSARGGGVVNMGKYSLSLVGYGPPVVSGAFIDAALQRIAEILPLWRSANSLVASTAVGTLLSSVADTVGDAASLLADSLSAIATQVSQASAVMSGNLSSASVGLSNLIGVAEDARASVLAIIDVIDDSGPFEPSPEQAEVDWLATEDDATLVAYEQSAALWPVHDALELQRVAGRFYGMNDADYASFLSSGGVLGGRPPTLSGAVRHTVNDTDTPDLIAARYGVEWVDVTRLNGADEAVLLTPGRTLSVPVTRAWGATPIDGLPVLGSHVGDAALGADVTADFAVDASTGDFGIVTASDCLAQGVRLRSTAVDAAMFSGLDDLPSELTERMLEDRVRRIYSIDPRVSTADVVVSREEALYRTTATLTAIDGSSLEVTA